MTRLLLAPCLGLYGWYLHVLGSLFALELNILDRGIAAGYQWSPGSAPFWMVAWWVGVISISTIEVIVLLAPLVVLTLALRAAVQITLRTGRAYTEARS